MRTFWLLVAGICLGFIIKPTRETHVKVDGISVMADALNQIKLDPEQYSFDYVKGFEDCQRAMIALLLKMKEVDENE